MKPHERIKLEMSLKLFIHSLFTKKIYIANFNIKDVLYTPFLLSPSHQEDKRSMARIQNY